MSEKFNPADPKYKKVEDPDKEQGDIELARKAYAEAYEGGGLSGKIKQIISAIRGGKQSEDGMLQMILDAEREDSLRERVDRGSIVKKSIEKYQGSYLRSKYKVLREVELPIHPLAPSITKKHTAKDFEEIEGVINGQKVFIKEVRTLVGKKRGATYRGTINGEEILPEDAEKIFREYENVAKNRVDVSTFRKTQENEEKDRKSRQKAQEKIQGQAEIKDKTRGLLEKIGMKESEDKSR